MTSFETEAKTARDLAREGVQLAARLQGKVEVRDKGRGLGPVTEADLAIEHQLLAGLQERNPHDTILSEETRPDLAGSASRLWCVDPIDGTYEYSRGLQEYAVQVGLLCDGQPVAGACALPTGQVFWGWEGGGAHVDDDEGSHPLRVEPCEDLTQAVAVHSRRHLSQRTEDTLGRLGVSKRLRAGGCGFKVAQILLGRAHIYLHAGGGTIWWDTVGPAAVLLAAGGAAADATGAPLRYEGDTNHRDGLLFAAPGLLPLVKGVLGS